VHPFATALEERNADAAIALLADDVVFRSPVVFRPYRGRDAVAPILRAVVRVFDDFRYVREIVAADGTDHAVVFEASTGERQIEGCDFLHLDERGLVDEFFVMVRPLSGTLALAEAMKAQLEADFATQRRLP
jgi:hypothetical protein